MKKFEEIKIIVKNQLEDNLKYILNDDKIQSFQKNIIKVNIEKGLENIDEVTVGFIARNINILFDSMRNAQNNQIHSYFNDYMDFLSEFGGVKFDVDGNAVRTQIHKEFYSGIVDSIINLGLNSEDLNFFEGRVITDDLRDMFVKIVNARLEINIPLIEELKASEENFDNLAILNLRNGFAANVLTSNVVYPNSIFFENDIIKRNVNDNTR